MLNYRLLTLIFAVLMTCGFAVAQQTAGDTALVAKKLPEPARREAPLEMARYLGVATSPASAALREQLRIKPGIGLVVEHVDKASPAEQAGLKQYDLLQKFDEQWLVNSEQMAVLIRNSDPGSEVRLSIIRQGQPQTLVVKLADKMLPPLTTGIYDPMMEWSLSKKGSLVVDPADPFKPARAENFSIGSGSLLIKSTVGQYVESLKRDNGVAHLVVTDAAGNTVFDSDLKSEQDLSALPPDVDKRTRVLLSGLKISLPSTRPAAP